MTHSFKSLAFSVGLAGATLVSLGIAAPSHATTLTGFSTFGDQMAGMKVTVNFMGGGSETNIWGVTGPGAGGAFGTNWSLIQSGNTFTDPWTLDYSGAGSISSLAINAVPGNTVFDRTNPSSGTPGSAQGKDFSVLSGLAPTFAYSTPIDISVGDLFGKLSLNWDNGFTRGQLTYLADTDSGTTDDPVSVPEPGLMVGLVAIGAYGAGSLIKRRQVKVA